MVYILKRSALLLGLFFSLKAHATCPPIVPCKPDGIASTISGSNADTKMQQMVADIQTSSQEVAASIVDMGSAISVANSRANKDLIAVMMKLSDSDLERKMAVDKALQSANMAHEAQLAEREYQQSVSVVSKNDTQQEVSLILETLRDYPDMSVPEVVTLLSIGYDENPEGKILVPIKSAEGICSSDQIKEEGRCSIPQKVYPSKKLHAFFNQCSIEKRSILAKEKSEKSKRLGSGMANVKTAEAAATTDSIGAVSSRLQNQSHLSCSPSNFKAKLCRQDLSREDYQEKIALGEIIPNGSISATNFSSPTITSGEGYLGGDIEAMSDDLRIASLDRTELQDNPSQRVVPIHHTYRNANQVKAASDFIDNLVGDDLVSNLPASDRRRVSHAEFQARYLNRMAALSTSRMVLTQSMTMRVGDKMSDIINAGTLGDQQFYALNFDSPANKESVLGAGSLDMLKDRVAKVTGSMQLPSAASGDGSANPNMVVNPSTGEPTDRILDSLNVQMELMMQEVLLNDQMIMMEAISLSQRSNSSSTLNKLNGLRNGSK
jgi:hypothetical protein